MKSLTMDVFNQWMRSCGKASVENNPQASANLFAQEAIYDESPVDEPITGRDASYAYWNEGAKTLKDKQSTYQILSVKTTSAWCPGSRNSLSLNRIGNIQ